MIRAFVHMILCVDLHGNISKKSDQLNLKSVIIFTMEPHRYSFFSGFDKKDRSESKLNHFLYFVYGF